MRQLTTGDDFKWCRLGNILYCDIHDMKVFLYGQKKAVKIFWRFYLLK